MTIVDIEWHPYRLPFAKSFATAHGEMATRKGAILTITTTTGIIGIGEIAPLPEFADDDIDAALAPLPELISHLRGKTLYEALALLYSQIQVIHLPTSTTCGLEIALLDALGKCEGRPVSSYLLGAMHSEVPNAWPLSPREYIPANTVISTKSIQAAVALANEAKQHGFRCIKLKVGHVGSLSAEVERIAAVRAAIGPEMHLRLDANEAWNFATASLMLSQCVSYTIQYIEQPISRYDLSGMYRLRQITSIPIAADEALHDLHSARRILAQQAADVLIIKPQLVGGPATGRQIIYEAFEQGIQSVVTTTIESGIGLVAALHLAAASPEITLECGLATQHFLLDDLIIENLPINNGSLAVPAGPGLGVTVDNEALAWYGENREQS